MKCQRCFAELPKQAQFCLRCGTPVAGTATGATASGFPGSVPRSPNRSLLAVVALLSLLVVGLGATVIKNGLTQKNGESGPTTGLVQAPGQSGGPTNLVQAPGEAPPTTPLVQQPGDTAPAPVEIVDYLNFVKQCEATKQRIIHDADRDVEASIPTAIANQYKEFLNGTNNPTSTGDPSTASKSAIDASKIADNFQHDFDELAGQFQTKQPPKSCVALRDAYYTHLGKVEARTLKVLEIFKNLGDASDTRKSELLQEALGMRGQNNDLDNDAKIANDAKNDICNTYHIQSTFDITGDEGKSSGMTGLGF